MYHLYIKSEVLHPRYKYLLTVHRCALAIKLFRIGQRLNQPKLRMSAKEELSKLYFFNCNPTYCLIYATDKYQEKCRLDEHKEYLDDTECFVRDLSRGGREVFFPTSGGKLEINSFPARPGRETVIFFKKLPFSFPKC